MKYRFALVVMVTLFVVAGFAWSADDSDTRQAPSKAQGSVQSGKSVVNSEDNHKVTPAVTSSEDNGKVTPPVSVPEETEPAKNPGNKEKSVWTPAPPAPPPQQPRGEHENRGGWSPGWNDHPRGGHHDRHHGNYGNPWRPWHSRRHWDFWMGPVFVPYPVFVHEPDFGSRHGRGVYVRYSGDDELGSDVARSLRAQLSDHGLRTVYSADEARLELYIVSMDQDEDNPGSVAAVAVTYIWMPGNRFITTQLLDVPSVDVGDVGDYLAGHAREMIDEYK